MYLSCVLCGMCAHMCMYVMCVYMCMPRVHACVACTWCVMQAHDIYVCMCVYMCMACMYACAHIWAPRECVHLLFVFVCVCVVCMHLWCVHALCLYVHVCVCVCELWSQKYCEFRYMLQQFSLDLAVFWQCLRQKLYCLRATNCTGYIFLTGFLLPLLVIHKINVQTLKEYFLMREMHIQLFSDTDVFSW